MKPGSPDANRTDPRGPQAPQARRPGGTVDLLRDMALFVEVAQSRSFTRAALELGVETSTVSRRVAALERDLGLPLFSRTTRRVELTQAGSDYLAQCLPLVEAARVAHESVGRGAQEATGTLRLSCTPDFAVIYLPPVLEAYTRRHPQVNVELDLSPRAVDLHGEPIDAALRIGPLADSSLVARPVGWLARGVYASPAYLRLAGLPQRPSDLAHHMAVRLRGGEAARQWRFGRREVAHGNRGAGHVGAARRGAAEMGAAGVAATDAVAQEAVAEEVVTVSGRFAAGSVSMVRELVLRGAGVGLLDERLVAADVSAGHLQRVLQDWTIPPAPVHLLTVSRFVPARVRLFAQMLAEALA